MSLKKLQIDPAILLLGIYAMKIKILRLKYLHLPICSSIIYNGEDIETKYPLTDKWIKELWYLYTVEYYSAIKDEILPFELTWIDPVKLVKKYISDLRFLEEEDK